MATGVRPFCDVIALPALDVAAQSCFVAAGRDSKDLKPLCGGLLVLICERRRAKGGSLMKWLRRRFTGKVSETPTPQPTWNEDTREVQALVDRNRAIAAQSGWAAVETGLLRTVRDRLAALE